MKMRKFQAIVLALLLYSVGFNIFLVMEGPQDLSYEGFQALTESVMMDALKRVYENLEMSVPVLRAYPGNAVSNWTDAEWTAHGDNGLMPTHVMGSIDHGLYMSSVSIHYTPLVKEKTYLGVHHLVDYEHEFMAREVPMDLSRLQVYNTSFSDHGLAVHVTTYLKEAGQESTASDMVRTHANIVTLIQHHLNTKE